MRITGTVKWYGRKLCYGFIAGDDGKDYFFHRSELPKSYVKRNEKVEFEPAEGERGLTAKGIVLVTA